jgi:hypothetical protein
MRLPEVKPVPSAGAADTKLGARLEQSATVTAATIRRIVRVFIRNYYSWFRNGLASTADNAMAAGSTSAEATTSLIGDVSVGAKLKAQKCVYVSLCIEWLK